MSGAIERQLDKQTRRAHRTDDNCYAHMTEFNVSSSEVVYKGPMDLSFALPALALLAIPGPTNALLAASGVAAGPRRSAPLLIADLAGYLAAIIALRAGVAPLLSTMPFAGVATRAVVIVYLI